MLDANRVNRRAPDMLAAHRALGRARTLGLDGKPSKAKAKAAHAHTWRPEHFAGRKLW